MLARFLIACLLALALPLQAQARTGFFACGEAGPPQHCAEHQGKKAAPATTHCSACLAVGMVAAELQLPEAGSEPILQAAPEPISLEAPLFPPQPPPRVLTR